MKDLHGLFIAAAYGLTALALILEWVMLLYRRKSAQDRVVQERAADESSVPNT